MFFHGWLDCKRLSGCLICSAVDLPPPGHFKRTLPQVSLNFVRHQHVHDFATPHEFDAAIQYGYGNWPSANARYLIGKETSIVCSPNCATPCP